MRKHGHPVRRVTVWPCRSNGHGKWLLAVCRRYFTVIISHPKCFLSHLWNTDSKQMAWSSVKDIQAKKTSRKAYFQELLLHLTGKLYEIWNIPKQFFLNNANIYEGHTMCFWMNEKWFLLSKELGSSGDKSHFALPIHCKNKDQKSMGCLSLKKKELFGNPIVLSGPRVLLHHWEKKYINS